MLRRHSKKTTSSHYTNVALTGPIHQASGASHEICEIQNFQARLNTGSFHPEPSSVKTYSLLFYVLLIGLIDDQINERSRCIDKQNLKAKNPDSSGLSVIQVAPVPPEAINDKPEQGQTVPSGGGHSF